MRPVSWFVAAYMFCVVAFVTGPESFGAKPCNSAPPPSLMVRAERIVTLGGMAVRSLWHPPPAETIITAAAGGWHTMGYLAGVFILAAQGKKVPEPLPFAPCEPPATPPTDNPDSDCDPQTGPPPKKEQEPEWDPKSASMRTAAKMSKNTEFPVETLQIAAAADRIRRSRGLPERASVVIFATGYQESGMRNLNYGDRDSVGWLQQRAGWGSVKQRMDPGYGAGKFFDALVKVRGWEKMSITRAAQRVQISAYPNAYAKHERKSRRLLSVISGAPTARMAEPNCEPEKPAGKPLSVSNPSGRSSMDGKAVSRVVKAQILLLEKKTGDNWSVMQGGFGGSHYKASGTSHKWPGVVDLACYGEKDCKAKEKAARQVGFAAWARNVPGRSYVGEGDHVHAVSLLDPKTAKSAQITGSWKNDGNGLSGYHNDPAPHYEWYPELRKQPEGRPA